MKSPQITIRNLQRGILEKITRQTTSTVREVDCAKLILAIFEGHSNTYLQKELGKKGKSGILKDMNTRSAYL